MTQVDVAVVGGGVTGLASALALSRLGASVFVTRVVKGVDGTGPWCWVS